MVAFWVKVRQKMLRKMTILMLFFFIGTVGTAFAGFRCGPELVSIGDTKVEVLGKCGEPTFKEITSVVTGGSYGRNLPYGKSYDRVTQAVEEWTYNCGPHNFIKILVFRGGTLRDIETGDYGSGQSDCVGAVNRKISSYETPHGDETPDAVPSPESAYGRISIFGLPYLAKVYLDDRYVGETPLTLDYVATGPHNLLVKKEQHKDLLKRVVVEPGETLHLEVYLEIDW
jgi:hypothetical protein